MTPTEIVDTVTRASAGSEIKWHVEGEALVLDLEPVLEATAKAAMELEREACAKICEDRLPPVLAFRVTELLLARGQQ